MDQELIPPLIGAACFIVALAGLGWRRHRKLRRMTPEQRAWFLKSERQYLRRD